MSIHFPISILNKEPRNAFNNQLGSVLKYMTQAKKSMKNQITWQVHISNMNMTSMDDLSNIKQVSFDHVKTDACQE